MTYVATIWDRTTPFSGLTLEQIRSGLPLGERGTIVLARDVADGQEVEDADVVAVQSYDPALPPYAPMDPARAEVIGQWLVLRLSDPTVAAPDGPELSTSDLVQRMDTLQTQVDDLTAMLLDI